MVTEAGFPVSRPLGWDLSAHHLLREFTSGETYKEGVRQERKEKGLNKEWSWVCFSLCLVQGGSRG